MPRFIELHGQRIAVVEIRRAGVDKGSALLAWTTRDDYDFILGIGDDTTDEDLFRAMPESAVSIRVGISATHAQYNLRGSPDVIQLLRSFANLRDSLPASDE